MCFWTSTKRKKYQCKIIHLILQGCSLFCGIYWHYLHSLLDKSASTFISFIIIDTRQNQSWIANDTKFLLSNLGKPLWRSIKFYVTLASPPHLESPCSPSDALDLQTYASSTQEMSQLKIFKEFTTEFFIMLKNVCWIMNMNIPQKDMNTA